MYNPISTYRIQFHKGFDFNAFENIIPYLAKLGIKTIYASPILKATPGSTHGYDCTDPHMINPEIGTLEQLYTISKTLKAAGMGWLQDISPNHMAYHSENNWLTDVLKKGKESRYARYFDIEWEHTTHPGKLQAPFLAASLGETIEHDEIRVVMHEGAPVIKYNHLIFPLSDESIGASEDVNSINADKVLLRKLLDEQHYVLCPVEGARNYRRFFTINDLICLNMQDEVVFNDYHLLIKKLVDEGVIQGLRIDHIDGLADPTEYLFRVRQSMGGDLYLVVEKILERNEKMSRHWPSDGNTGYDFMAFTNNLLTKKKNEPQFNSYYSKELGQKEPFGRQLLRKKKLILCSYMDADLDSLCVLFKSLQLATDEELQQVGEEAVRNAIAAFLVRCPVYRFYGNRLPLEPEEAKAVGAILNSIGIKDERTKNGASLLSKILLTKPLEGNPDFNIRAAHFFMRCMQFSGPLMAKGVEDTLMYTYNRFIGHNEVGDSPEQFGISVRDFGRAMHVRQLKCPYALNASSTHDTKRGEDIRARLNVLTDIPDEWFKVVSTWRKINTEIKDNEAPDTNDEYSIYQTLVGSCFSCESLNEDIKERLLAYYQKAFREAKTHTDWNHPDKRYEDSVDNFLNRLFYHSAFLESITVFQEKITDAGIVNSLNQVLLKCTCPGVPDFYQGSEMWNFSLVDPDNRRPVDYARYHEALEYVTDNNKEGLVKELWASRKNGKIKLWLANRLLSLRNEDVDAFSKGHYLSLKVSGTHKRNVMAYARVYARTWYVFIIPLNIGLLCQKQNRPVSDIDWADTCVILPEEVPTEFENIVLRNRGKHTGKIPIKDVFFEVPFAIIKYKLPGNARGAGVLLPVFSLHSPFGIGDFGKGARAFADFLCRSKQKYWQLLPLNPADEQNSYSPYSSISAMAGNPLLISPEMLAYDNLIKEIDLRRFQLPNQGKVDYAVATKLKFEFLSEAYAVYKNGYHPLLEYKFRHFCNKHSYWLDDFACFVALKRQFNSDPWYMWPSEYKQRNRKELDEFMAQNIDELDKIKWRQFLAEKQWKLLRDYCNNLGISLVGDIPFYTSYDSVDVWAHPEYFSVDQNGNMTGVAGVPPDYFSSTGQLWNVPTFNWENMKANNYDWWVTRLQRQLELFDLIRLDHFRALADYWQVPPGETTAQNGTWLKGPGIEFFETISGQVGKLPFIAEDLGNDMENAYLLRDKIGLPGMKVLQFAWGDNMPQSVDAPHNYPHNCIVYTGTHDNNTTVGWYNEETRKEDHDRLKAYVGKNVKRNNIHIVMSRLAYASVARIAILPIQDILGLDASARINLPGSDKNNWLWRLPPNALRDKTAGMLEHWTKLYNRE